MPFVSDEVRAARVASTCALLVALDPPWTTRSVTGVDDDREPSLMIVGQMLEGLAVLASEQEFLSDLGRNLDAATIKATLAEVHLDSATSRKLTPLLTPAQIKKRAPLVSAALADERQQLSAQAATLRSGRAAAGDMSRNGKCAIGWVMLAAGGILQAWPLGAAGGLLIAENCGPVV